MVVQPCLVDNDAGAGHRNLERGKVAKVPEMVLLRQCHDHGAAHDGIDLALFERLQSGAITHQGDVLLRIPAHLFDEGQGIVIGDCAVAGIPYALAFQVSERFHFRHGDDMIARDFLRGRNDYPRHGARLSHRAHHHGRAAPHRDRRLAVAFHIFLRNNHAGFLCRLCRARSDELMHLQTVARVNPCIGRDQKRDLVDRDIAQGHFDGLDGGRPCRSENTDHGNARRQCCF